MSRRRIIIIFLAAVFLFAGIAASFLRKNYAVPVIMYHRVLTNPDPGYKLAVSSRDFYRQMRFLKENNFNVLPLSELVRLVGEKKKLPPRTIAITFDDGYRDNYICAFPILKKFRLPATIFVIVDEIGRINSSGIRDRVSWEEIALMRDSGVVSIGSHSLGPEPLINIDSEKEIRNQIFNSKRILEEKLGEEVSIFSYPEGMFNQKIKDLVIAAGYKGAVATVPGREYPDDDIFTLKRIRIAGNASNLFIFAVETSGFYMVIKEYKKARKNGRK